MKLKSRLIICAILFTSLSFQFAMANDEGNWLKAKADLTALPIERTPEGYQKWCQKSWDILWPWAKKGNLEARADLLDQYYMLKRQMPGHSDWISIKRDLVVLLIHTEGYVYKERKYEGSRLDPAEALKELLDSDYPTSTEFSACREKNLTAACTDQAVKKGLVPSFEDYAAEIDFQVSSGKVSHCGLGMAFFGDQHIKKEN